LSSSTSRQIAAAEELSHLKAVALAWFDRHRPQLLRLPQDKLQALDTQFRRLLESSDKSPARAGCKATLATTKNALVSLRSDAVLLPPDTVPSTDAPPDLARLVADPAMGAILSRRWTETIACRDHGAHLAATVMMGALLEALLLARANKLPDPSPLFKAKMCPKAKATGKPLPLTEWTLKHYLDVGHELSWITRSAKDVGEVLRDYRNYIHPEKELRHGVTIGSQDSRMFWGIFQSLASQIVASV
jgi:hypothetical protein